METLTLDFSRDPYRRKASYQTGRNLLWQIFKKVNPGHVWDLSAGWGVDAFCMAKWGAEVDAVERSKHVFEILKQCIATVPQDVAPRLRIHYGEALEFMDNEISFRRTPVDFIYFDPLFGGKNRTALPGKREQFLRLWTGNTLDNAEKVVEKAIHHCRYLVIKRHIHDKLLLKGPCYQRQGKSIRFDVYRNKRSF